MNIFKKNKLLLAESGGMYGFFFYLPTGDKIYFVDTSFDHFTNVYVCVYLQNPENLQQTSISLETINDVTFPFALSITYLKLTYKPKKQSQVKN